MSPEESDPTGLHPDTPEEATPALVPSETAAAVVAPTGKRPAFSKIRRELSEQDLANPGVQKMLLEELERAEEKLETAEGYRHKFHIADRETGVLRQQLQSQKANEILYAAGVAVGSILIGIGPSFWDTKGGWFVPLLGVVLLVGSLASRIVKYES
jgi:hypothetical protein